MKKRKAPDVLVQQDIDKYAAKVAHDTAVAVGIAKGLYKHWNPDGGADTSDDIEWTKDLVETIYKNYELLKEHHRSKRLSAWTVMASGALSAFISVLSALIAIIVG